MKRFLISITLTSLLFANDCPLKVPNVKPDLVLKKSDWVYKKWITQKGTRSEGYIGVLFYKNRQYCINNQPIKTPLGKFKFIKAKYLWGWHGWKPMVKDKKMYMK